MKKILTTSKDYREAVESIRLQLGLPADHIRVRREAAIRLVIKDGNRRDHSVGAQGTSFECCRCGMTASLAMPAGSPADGSRWVVVGDMADKVCSV